MIEKVQKYLLDALNFSMENNISLEKLTDHLLEMALDLCQSRVGYIAISDPLNDANMQYAAVRDLPTIRIGQPFKYKHGRTLVVPEQYKKQWMIFPLTFHGKICGVVGLANLTNMTLAELRTVLNPLLPVAMSNIIGGHLLSLEVQNSHDLFLSTMSHEIRTPLNGIVAGSRLLADLGALNPDQMHNLRIITECSYQLVDIINDILDFTKIRCGRMQLESLPFNLKNVIDEAYDVVSIRAQEKKLNVWFDFDDSVPQQIVGDKKRMRQILVNLLANAVKFTSKGQVGLKVFYDITNQMLHCEVSDTGCGIEQSEYEHIFDAFQTKNTYHSNKEGTGLGLAISRNLARQMGGDVELKDSVVGRGTTMHVYLKMEVVRDSVDMTPINNATVLVAHADGKVRMQLTHVLTQWNAKAMLCSTQDEMMMYLDPAYKHSIDIVIMSTEFQLTRPFARVIGLHSSASPPKGFAHHLNIEATIDTNQLAKQLLQLVSAEKSRQTIVPKEIVKNERKVSILIVEDNSYNMTIMQQILKRLGFDEKCVDEAHTGLEAVQKASSKLYEIIFMDLKMPVMNGYDATHQILTLYKNRCPRTYRHKYEQLECLRPTIIAMTACVMDTDQSRCKKVGMKAFLGKPLVMEEVEVMTNLALRRREESKQFL